MSKKILALALTLVMALTLSAAVFADGERHPEGTQDVTTVVPANPLYTVTIPKTTAAVPFGQLETSLGTVSATVTDLWDNTKILRISMNVEPGDPHAFTCPETSTSIPYSVGKMGIWGSPQLTFTDSKRTDSVEVGIEVEKDAWLAADPGNYSTTITYRSQVVD